MKKGEFFRCNFFAKNRGGQVWVETVIYTLIALVMMGAVMSFVIPRIEEIQDKSVIEQSVRSMNDVNSVVQSVVQSGPGNKRIIQTNIKKGNFIIDGTNNEIRFEIETNYEYSEPCDKENITNCDTINVGNIVALTKKEGGTNKVILTSDYASYDLTYNGGNDEKTIGQSSSVYSISIENKGEVTDGAATKINIDFNLS